LRLIGCDAVGMSTAPEAIVAAHCGLKTIGLSIITNKALFPGEKGAAACHEEVIETIEATQHDIEAFVRDLICAVGQQQHS
jgi:purine-nucleoside phosphorylase